MPTRNLGNDMAFGTQNLNLKTESWYKRPLNKAIAQDISLGDLRSSSERLMP